MVAGGWTEERIGSYCLLGTQFQFGMLESSGNTQGNDCNNVNATYALNCTLRNGYNGGCILYFCFLFLVFVYVISYN